MNFTEEELTAAVLQRLSATPNPRFKHLMTAAVKHIHAFVKEVELTEEEWMHGIQFLTSTGQKCNELRQEFILLSDTLGVSMLVDAIGHRLPSGATQSTVFGPFHRSGAPRLDMWSDISNGAPGESLYMHGRVLDVEGRPVEGVELDIWQADGVEGLYDVQRPDAPVMCRGIFCTAADGKYGFHTVKPTNYPIPSDGPVGQMLASMGRHPFRPAHVHAKVSKSGYRQLITHIFASGDPYLDTDAVFGVKRDLIADFTPNPPGVTPSGAISTSPFWTVEFDFRISSL